MMRWREGRMKVSPDLAREMLKRNICNRPIRVGYVSHLAKQMADGRFIYNGESVIFGSSDRLIDGQHRLLAIVESGKTVELYIVCGVENENAAFLTMDSGRMRTTSDFLQGAGHDNYRRLSSVLRVMWEYKVGLDNWRSLASSTTELTQILDRHKSIGEHIKSLPKGFLAPSLADFMSYAVTFTDQYRDRGIEFMDGVLVGVNLAANDPRLLLRNRLSSNMVASAKLKKEDILCLCIKAWNRFSMSHTLGTLKMSPKEEIQEIIGFPRSAV